jgi:hypothetical protein
MAAMTTRPTSNEVMAHVLLVAAMRMRIGGARESGGGSAVMVRPPVILLFFMLLIRVQCKPDSVPCCVL